MKFRIINMKSEMREITGKIIMELVLQRFVAQQLAITAAPPND